MIYRFSRGLKRLLKLEVILLNLTIFTPAIIELSCMKITLMKRSVLKLISKMIEIKN